MTLTVLADGFPYPAPYVDKAASRALLRAHAQLIWLKRKSLLRAHGILFSIHSQVFL
jgi:hypothetical protein